MLIAIVSRYFNPRTLSMSLCLIIIFLIQSTAAIDFSNITFQHVSVENLTDDDSVSIGWIKYASCDEGWSDSDDLWNYTALYDKEILNISKYAVTVKILPSTGI